MLCVCTFDIVFMCVDTTNTYSLLLFCCFDIVIFLSFVHAFVFVSVYINSYQHCIDLCFSYPTIVCNGKGKRFDMSYFIIIIRAIDHILEKQHCHVEEQVDYLGQVIFSHIFSYTNYVWFRYEANINISSLI